MDLHEFNTRILGSLNILADDEGYLSRVVEDETRPFTINGKRVVLPVGKHLMKSSKETIVFHPLSENITRSESDVIKALRDTVMYELTMRSITLLLEMARVSATPSEQKRLNGPSGKYLKDIVGLDEKIYLFLRDKLLTKISPTPENRLISVHLNKNQGKGTAGVLRSVKFQFPVLDALLSDEMVILGVKYPSQKARNILRALFQIVLGDEETRASFDYGSKNMTAPYFHALLTGYANMATHLNKIVKDHKKLLGKELADDLLIDLSYLEAMDDLADLRKVVPPQAGNEGAVIIATKDADDDKDTRDVRRNIADRVLPADRREAIRTATEDNRPNYDEEPLPWETDEEADRRIARGGRSLDDFLDARRSGGRRDYRDDDRRSRRRDYRDERDERPRYDLGIEREGRFDRRDDRYSRERDRFGQGHRRVDVRDRDDRYERDDGRRSFGAGHRTVGRFF